MCWLGEKEELDSLGFYVLFGEPSLGVVCLL